MTLEQILKKPDTRREWIKFQLKLCGTSYAQIGEQMGVSRHAPKRALYIHYPKMERAIAEAIGMTPEQIWPERYGKAA